MDSAGRQPCKGLVLWGVFLLATIGLSHATAAAQQANLPPQVVHYADTVLYNGKVLTADKSFTIVEAVAVRDGQFLAIGTTSQILPMAGPNTRKIDLQGKTVIPGIIDLHQHPFSEGMLSYWADKWFPNEPEWRNPQEVQEGIRRAVAKAKPGEPILIPRVYIGPSAQEEGGRVGEAICDMMTPQEKYTSLLPCAARSAGSNLCRVLTREQLDSAAPNNPIVFVGIVNLGPRAINTKAAEIIRPYMPEGAPIFDKEGSPCLAEARNLTTGGDLYAPQRLIKDFVMFWTEPLETQLVAYRNASQGVSMAGITLTKEHTALPLLTGIRELWVRGELSVRMRMPFPITPLTSVGNSVSVRPDQAELLFRRIGNMSGIGDDVLRFSNIRPEGVGGNMLSGGVWTLEPKLRSYSGRDGLEVRPYGGGGPGEGERGPIQPGEEIFDGREAVVQAVRFGWSVSTDHTIGDRAVREVVSAMEAGLQNQVVKTSKQLLHIGHSPTNVAVEDLQRMKRMGIRYSVGVWHIFLPDMLDAGVIQFGTERYDKMAMPLKTHLANSLPPALEGDVAGALFWRMEKAITRKDDKYKKAWNLSEAVSRQQALWMSTIYGAQELGEDDKLGSIEVGKLADLVVVDKDYMAVPEDDISEIKTLLTMVGGKVVFEVAGTL